MITNHDERVKPFASKTDRYADSKSELSSFDSKYIIIKILRKQPNISVFLAKDNKNSYSIIKSIELTSLSEYDLKISKQEVKLISTLNHPNIIKQNEYFYSTNSNCNNTLNLVMEYISGGDLSQSIKSRKAKYFSENFILDWFTQLCLAIKHLHDRKILHRDIKPSNIFLKENGLIKIGDFGLAKCLHHSKERAITVIGSPEYLSPEIILNRPYSFKSDIWAMGVTLFELCALKLPFNQKDLNSIYQTKKIPNFAMNIPKHYSKELKEMIIEMLKGDPINRPSVMALLMNTCIQKRIRKFVSQQVYDDEFSHTLLKDFAIDKDERKECDQCLKAKKEKIMIVNILNNNAKKKPNNGPDVSVSDLNDKIYDSLGEGGIDGYYKKEDIIQPIVNSGSFHHFKVSIKPSNSPNIINKKNIKLINPCISHTPIKLIPFNLNKKSLSFNKTSLPSQLQSKQKEKEKAIENKRREIEALIKPNVLKDINTFLSNYLNKINKNLLQEQQIHSELYNYLKDRNYSYEESFEGMSHLEEIYDLLQLQS